MNAISVKIFVLFFLTIFTGSTLASLDIPKIELIHTELTHEEAEQIASLVLYHQVNEKWIPFSVRPSPVHTTVENMKRGPSVKIRFERYPYAEFWVDVRGAKFICLIKQNEEMWLMGFSE